MNPNCLHAGPGNWTIGAAAVLSEAANHCTMQRQLTQGKNATIHQLTTMLSTSKTVLFPGHNHLLTTGADDPTL